MKITTTNGSGAAALAAAADSTTVQKENTAAADLDSIRLAINKTFHIVDDRLRAIADALIAEVAKKNASLETLTKLLSELNQWNTPPGVPKMPADPTDPVYKDRIDKTDALWLNGVSIPDDAYDTVKYSYLFKDGKTYTGYATLPIQALSDASPHGLVDGQLYWKPTPGAPNEKTYVRYFDSDFRTFDVSSPLAAKTKPHDDDFSKFQPGDLVQDDQTKKYYRVTNDKTGVEVTDYPLQKFIYTASADALYKMQNAVENQMATIRDLSKKDGIGSQRLSGDITLMSTMFPALAAAITQAMEAVLRHISQ